MTRWDRHHLFRGGDLYSEPALVMHFVSTFSSLLARFSILTASQLFRFSIQLASLTPPLQLHEWDFHC